MGRPTPQKVRDALVPWLVGRVNDDGEARAYCPICETPGQSSSPSASFNFEEGVFTCFSQCGGMSITTLVQMMKQDGDFDQEAKEEKKAAVRNIKDAPSQAALGKLPSQDRLNEYVDRLLSNRVALDVMRHKRGLTKKTIEEFQIGWNGERYTIPIYDEEGELVNVRKYNPNAKEAKNKMMSWAAGTGSRRLYGEDILAESETVIITEGEMDKIIGRQYGLPTITHTAGARTWDNRWNERFEGKTVFICYDCDEAGRLGARKVADALKMFAKAVHIITLPLPNKGDDLTNYFVDQGHSAADFYTLMKEASEKANRSAALASARAATPKKVGLEQTMNPEFHERPISFTATIAGKTQPPYITPARLEYNCNEGGGTRCGHCPISGRNHLEIDVDRNDPIALELVGKSKEGADRVKLKYVNIPHTCPDVEIEETEVYSVEELVLVPPADEHFGSVNQVDRKVFNVGKFDSPVNTKALFVGMNSTSSVDRRGMMLTWESESSASAIDKFTMSEEIMADLSAFWPDDGESPLDRMRAIAKDISLNVTKIYHRPELHMAYDLVWHSALNFSFKGVDLGKGWLELLVIGDTRTGKSEAAKRLCEHYRSGVLTTCEGASFAGLVGGVQQLANTWLVSWGTVPINDRRLVVLDEFSGIADKGILEQMSSVRSSGIAQINKIRSAETSARTRLIWIANPADGSKIEDFPNGSMDAIKGLAKNPEDVARFDFALSVASSDVGAEEINVSRPPRMRHRYTQKLCSQLVNWVWSRTIDQIIWEPGVENYVLEVARRMGSRYIPEPPLIQVENVRIKLARMAVAVAGRLFSCDETGELLIVGREHVEAAEELLDGFYGMPSFGYLEHSEKVLAERAEAVKNTKHVQSYLDANTDVMEVIKVCMSGPFKMRDFQEFGGLSQLEAQEVVRLLQQYRMIRRQSKGYMRAEPALVDIVKKMSR